MTTIARRTAMLGAVGLGVERGTALLRRWRKPWPDNVPKTMPLRAAPIGNGYTLLQAIADGYPACSVERGWCVKGVPGEIDGMLNMVRLPDWMQEELWRQDRMGSA